MKITTHLLCGTLIGLGLVSFSSAAELPGATQGFLATPLRVEDLDNAAFTAWADGEETAMEVKEGPRRALWTQTTRPEWDGVRFGQGKTPGPRHLRIGWTKPLPVGAVLVCGTVQLSVLKPDAAYPGNLAADAEWTAAQRVKGDGVSPEEAGRQDYALWVLPPGTATRAIRFTHTARLTDADYGAWLGGAYVLSSRVTNLAPQAVASADARPEAAARINDGSNNGFWDAWDNGQQRGGRRRFAGTSRVRHAHLAGAGVARRIVCPRPASVRRRSRRMSARPVVTCARRNRATGNRSRPAKP